jgi:hypothetical protein
MVYLTKKHLSRRTVLRGAGVAVALPFLQSMVPAGAFAQEADGVTKPPCRLACIYIPHGSVMEKWMPTGEGKGFQFSPILQSLEPLRESVNVISGLALPLAYGKDASAGANHARSSAVWITGAEPKEGAAARLGISVDQVAANHLGQKTPLPSLELSIEEGGLSGGGAGLSGAYRNTISWHGPISPLPMQHNPQVVFERLFGDGSTPEQRAARRSQSRSLLDSVMSEIGTLKVALPGEDRTRLDQYFTNLREVERRLELASTQIPEGLDVPAPPTGVPRDFETHVNLMFELVTLAWQAEITHISTLMLAKEVSNAVFPASGINDPFHNLSHHSEVPENKERLSRLQEYHMRTVTRFLTKLQETPDGDGTLLDHAMVLYGSGMSNSNQHDHDPLPAVLAGRACGALEGGRHIHAAKDTPMSNLLVAMLQKMNVPAEAFGDSTGVLSI